MKIYSIDFSGASVIENIIGRETYTYCLVHTDRGTFRLNCGEMIYIYDDSLEAGYTFWRFWSFPIEHDKMCGKVFLVKGEKTRGSWRNLHKAVKELLDLWEQDKVSASLKPFQAPCKKN